MLLDITTLPIVGNITDCIAAYGLVIVSFLAGIHWGHELSLGYVKLGLFISSNIIAVAVWASWLLLSPQLFIAILVLPLVVLLYIDFTLYLKKIISRNYFSSRMIITIVVIASLILASLSS